ncbi:MAG: dephospho-CoA kinase [Lachnospiraceae bacterium]|nr:dephospho-CoA kinase [Lachnospiraceae bacterium]
MAVIGITGGAGTGKSFVAKVAAENFDMLHIDTDKLARTQMMPGGASYAGVAEAFPDCVKCGEIDRTALADKVFGNRELLEKLNGLTHPNVREAVETLIKTSEGLFRHVLIETAILADAGYCPICDAVWFVTAPLEDRKKRLRERGYDEERIENVIGSQPSDEKYISTSTYVIQNGEAADEENIIEQIGEALKETGVEEKETEDDDEEE